MVRVWHWTAGGRRGSRVATTLLAMLSIALPASAAPPTDAGPAPLPIPRGARKVVGASVSDTNRGLAIRQMKALVGPWIVEMTASARDAMATWWGGAPKSVRHAIEQAGAVLEHLPAARIEAISAWGETRQLRFLRYARKLRARIVGTAATLRKRHELADEHLKGRAGASAQLKIALGAALDLGVGEAASRAALAARRLAAELVVETNAGPLPLEKAYADELEDARELLGSEVADDAGRRALAAIHVGLASGGWTSPGEIPVLEGPDGNARSIAALLRETGPRQSARAVALLDLLAMLEAIRTGAATASDLEAAADAIERITAEAR